MTFNVFWLLKILTYLNDEIMNVPKKIINKRDEGDNMYRVVMLGERSRKIVRGTKEIFDMKFLWK